MKKLNVYTRVHHSGQEILRFTLPFDGSALPEISIENNYLDTSIDCFLAMKTGRMARGILSASAQNGTLTIYCAPFSFDSPYRLHVGEDVYTADDAEHVFTEVADDFEPHMIGDIPYRLYRPQAAGPRPLILFLHGGGEGGTDNWRQLVGCFGPVWLAQRYPDCFVMAPQAKGGAPTPEELEAFKNLTFATSDQSPHKGWNRPTLAAVCDEIRRMIGDGLVDGKRVYVTGLSMGGAGTLRMLSVAEDLFAAAVPVCPSMTPETFHILCGLHHTKIWIAASYIDHTLYRHKYLFDGVLHLRDCGNRDAHLTVYSPEELAEYDIGIIDDMPLDARFGWNHMCWVPTYHDEHGIMSWMLAQSRP